MYRSRPFAIALVSAALLGAAASAQSATPTFKDVPAGHWAREAVEYIAQQGLIQGFPDGTFRGNQNLTRYQAALIFYRLLQNGKLPSNGTVQSGTAEVANQINDLTARMAALEKTTQDQAARLAQLEADVKRASELSQQSAALETRVAALEEQVKTMSATPQGQANADLAPRVQALEEQVKQLQSAPAGPAPDVTALTARVTELEQKVTTLSNQQPSTSSADAARISALEDQVKALQNQVNTLQSQQATLPPPPQPQPQPQPSPEIQPVPPVTPPAPRARNLYVGAGFSVLNLAGSGDLFSGNNTSVGGLIGVRSLLLGLGLRAGVDYGLGTVTLSDGSTLANPLLVQAFLTKDFNPGGTFNPYLGLGATFNVSAPDILSNTFGTGLVGVDLNFLGPVGLFVEATPGFGAGQSFSIGAKAGLKLNF
ncbi:MAG: S-layer homology domain-containing protein [Thermaceae bacterium]|nr:S-layer homology domain-containing protein [Thermaceae bacterium]